MLTQNIDWVNLSTYIKLTFYAKNFRKQNPPPETKITFTAR